MTIPLRRNSRGFLVGEWLDLYDKPCSIQMSSLATDDALWLGCDTGTHVDGACLARMHLSRDMAAALVPLLIAFVETGELPEDEQSK